MTTIIHSGPEWFELIGLAFCIGVLVCRILVLPPSARAEFPYQGNLLSGMWRSFGIGIAVMFAGSIANLLLRATEISGQPISMVFPVLPTVVFRTHIGRVWLIRIAALTFLSITLKVGRGHRDSSGFPIFMLAFALIISMTESASGHASDKGDFSVAEMMDWLHLLAVSVWGGGLLVLSIIILPELARQGERIAALNASVAGRFSRIAGIGVGLVLVTAFYNAWLYVGSFGAFWKTSYGWTVTAKIFLFSLIIYLGAFNRYVSVPLLQECACFSSSGPGIMERIAVRFFPRYLCTEEKSLIFSRFMWSVKVEAFLIVAVLLCAALLRHEIPGRHASHMGHPGEKMHSMPQNNADSPHDHSDHQDHDGTK